jgi:hypothetical protein
MSHISLVQARGVEPAGLRRTMAADFDPDDVVATAAYASGSQNFTKVKSMKSTTAREMSLAHWVDKRQT